MERKLNRLSTSPYAGQRFVNNYGNDKITEEDIGLVGHSNKPAMARPIPGLTEMAHRSTESMEQMGHAVPNVSVPMKIRKSRIPVLVGTRSSEISNLCTSDLNIDLNDDRNMSDDASNQVQKLSKSVTAKKPVFKEVKKSKGVKRKTKQVGMTRKRMCSTAQFQQPANIMVGNEEAGSYDSNTCNAGISVPLTSCTSYTVPQAQPQVSFVPSTYFSVSVTPSTNYTVSQPQVSVFPSTYYPCSSAPALASAYVPENHVSVLPSTDYPQHHAADISSANYRVNHSHVSVLPSTDYPQHHGSDIPSANYRVNHSHVSVLPSTDYSQHHASDITSANYRVNHSHVSVLPSAYQRVNMEEVPVSVSMNTGAIVHNLPVQNNMQSGRCSNQFLESARGQESVVGQNIIDIGVVPTMSESVHDELDLNLPQSIRQKIAKGEYIDLSQLLNISKGRETKRTLHVGPSGEIIAQDKTSSPIGSIEIWTDVFLVYASVFLRSHPNRLQEILKYIHTIRFAALRGYNWVAYDEQFRLKRSLDPSSLWSKVDYELWLFHMSGVNKSLSVNKHTAKCFDFNYKGACSKVSCQYGHFCISCGGNHAELFCTSRVPHNAFVKRYTEGVYQRPFTPGPRGNFGPSNYYRWKSPYVSTTSPVQSRFRAPGYTDGSQFSGNQRVFNYRNNDWHNSRFGFRTPQNRS
ncbi:hypothetical protein SNE40_002536 [Patella caerulea]|uniref:C3H1-type domain-containing protein n=1 Tax=Patella caerulea TaxID=87958 RepID=A0AAN8KCE7_PATCE